MKLRTLSQFMRSLVEPLSQSGATADTTDGLRRACELLASMGELSVSQFADALEQARAFQVSRQHAFPAYLQPTLNCYESIKSLKNRAAAPDVNRDELRRDLALVPLDALELKDLTALATDLGWQVPQKAKKPEVVNVVWRGITGEDKPKKAASRRTSKPTSSVPIHDYAQKINELKERANSPEATREELEQGLSALNLGELGQKDLVALGKQLACDVNGKTKKDDAIDCIQRVVLEVKELQSAGIR